MTAETALVSELASITSALEMVAQPDSLERWSLGVNIALAVLTFGAVAAAVWSAVVANRSLSAAREAAGAAMQQAAISAEALGHEQVRDLRSEFDDREYFIRFWRLNMLTRDMKGVEFGSTLIDVQTYGKHPRTQSVIGPSSSSDLTDEELRKKGIDISNRLSRFDMKQIVCDALGPESSPDRADLYGVYWFALRVAGFLEPDPERRAIELTRAFGVQLVSTLSNHRVLAARLVPTRPGAEADYYGVAYGLNDPAYCRMFEMLYLAASKTALPSDTLARIREGETIVAGRGYLAASLPDIAPT